MAKSGKGCGLELHHLEHIMLMTRNEVRNLIGNINSEIESIQTTEGQLAALKVKLIEQRDKLLQTLADANTKGE